MTSQVGNTVKVPSDSPRETLREREISVAYPVGKPIGFFISARVDHPAYPVLEKLEINFGPYFQELTTPQLRMLLTFCTIASDFDQALSIGQNQIHALDELDGVKGLKEPLALLKQLRQISQDLLLDLIPFLVSQIQARRQR